MRHFFTSVAHANLAIEDWRRAYNTERPHSALSNLEPITYAARNVLFRPGTLRSTRLRTSGYCNTGPDRHELLEEPASVFTDRFEQWIKVLSALAAMAWKTRVASFSV